MADQRDVETAMAIGRLTEAITAVNDRLSGQSSEFLRTITEMKDQLHEVKHDQRQLLTQNVVLGERLATHLVADEKNFGTVVSEIKENRSVSQATIVNAHAEVASELRDYRLALGGEIAELKNVVDRTQKQVGDLLLWRKTILTMAAGVMVVVGFFGKSVIELGVVVLHYFLTTIGRH